MRNHTRTLMPFSLIALIALAGPPAHAHTVTAEPHEMVARPEQATAEREFELAWQRPNGTTRDGALVAFSESWTSAELGESGYLLPLARLMTTDDKAKPATIDKLARTMIAGGSLSAEEIDRLGGRGMARTIIENYVAMPLAGFISSGEISLAPKGIDLLASVWDPAEAYRLVCSELKRNNSVEAKAELAASMALAANDERITGQSLQKLKAQLDAIRPGDRSMSAIRGLQMTGRSTRWAPASSGVNTMGFRAVSGPGLDGDPIRSNDHLGKVVVVQFWVSWCSGCAKQAGELVELREMFDAEDLVIIGVNLDAANKRDEVAQAAARLGFDWDHIYTGEGWRTAAFTENRVVGIPLVVVLDREGRPRDASMGTRRLQDVIRLAIDESATTERTASERLSGR